jgi:uncharacterized protein
MSFIKTLNRFERDKLIHPPKWLIDNTMYCTQMGSVAYGVSNDMSDIDIYGFCIPPKGLIFPHLAGEILGFGRQLERFNQWEEHHINDVSTQRQYDMSIYSIVKYFQLCMDNNPNMIDSLFTSRRCILHSTQIAERVIEKRKIFLHKGAWHKFKGYAYSQMSKIDGGQNSSNPRRAKDIAQYGYDTKFAYHVVRLLGEVEQIMIEHDLDLERNREQLKSIRRGEWELEYLRQWFADKEKSLEQVYTTSTLPHDPDEGVIKTLLLECLEHHYGSVDKMIRVYDKQHNLISDMYALLEKYKY